MRFREIFTLRYIVFAVIFFILLVLMAVWDSNTQVNVSMQDTSISIRSNEFGMFVEYEQIASVELVPLAEAGEKKDDAFDNKILRSGYWKNDTWGDYCINADLDATTCIVMHLTDGRIFVFNCKDDARTEELHRELLYHLA